MAIKGVSLAEKEPIILKSDPAHPDQIKKELKKRLADIGDPDRRDEEKPRIEDAIKEEAGEPTVFHIGNLSRADRIELGDLNATPTLKDGGISMQMRRTQRAYALVERGLVGWENMLSGTGRAVAFKKGTGQVGDSSFKAVVSDECMSHLSQEVVIELSEAILKKNGMTSDMVGNSEGQSPPLIEQSSENSTARPAPQNNNVSEDAQVLPN